MVQRETLLIFILLSSLQCGKGMQINNAKLFSLHPDHPLIWQKGFVRLLGCRVQVSTKEELPSRSVRMREGYQTNNSAMMKWSMFGASWPAFLLWTMAVLNIEVIQQGLNKIQKHYFSGSVPSSDPLRPFCTNLHSSSVVYWFLKQHDKTRFYDTKNTLLCTKSLWLQPWVAVTVMTVTRASAFMQECLSDPLHWYPLFLCSLTKHLQYSIVVYIRIWLALHPLTQNYYI